jgi:uncharacterized protein (TIGR02452 family)
MATRRAFREKIAYQNQDEVFPVLVRSDDRVRDSLTTSSLYPHPEALPPPPTGPSLAIPKTVVTVVNADSFDCAEALTRQGKQAISVLNMANAVYPGGGYMGGSGAQEEALCRRSTLYLTIRRQRGFHPIPDHGGIYSPDVLVFRTSDDDNCALLSEEDRWWTSVISVAAIDTPLLTRGEEDYYREEDRASMLERMRTILRIAACEERKNLVLGALGCGAFRNPPEQVAVMFKSVFEETEFKGRFEGIWFAVIEKNGSGNFTVFKDVLDGMEF